MLARRFRPGAEAYVTGTQFVESLNVATGEVQLVLGSTYDRIAEN